jgi:hypothetical protein
MTRLSWFFVSLHSVKKQTEIINHKPNNYNSSCYNLMLNQLKESWVSSL